MSRQSWTGLVDLVGKLRRHAAKLPATAPLREAAAGVAISEWGAEVVREQLAAVNVGALAIRAGANPAVYFARPSASAVVHSTDLHSIPDAPPRLLRSAGIVEARRPETGERLWGSVASLGWYEVVPGDAHADGATGAYYLVGLGYPDGIVVARWRPSWTGHDLEPELPEVDRSPLIDDVDSHHEFARASARYLIVLGLLAESDPSPLRIEIDRRERGTRHVYLGDHAPPARDVDAADVIEGRVAEAVAVRGHLKRQRYGDGRERVRWIYVAGYEARRWFAPRWDVAHKDPS